MPLMGILQLPMTFMLKESILSEYEYLDEGTEGKFINFLKRRPLARLHEKIQWEIFHKCPKWINKKKIWTIDEEDPEVSIEPDVIVDMVEGLHVDPFEEAEQHMELADALKQLTEEEQKIIVMSFYEQYSDQEVADILGKPRTTVVSIKQRALAKMKKFMIE